jgi:hypothetical protein
LVRSMDEALADFGDGRGVGLGEALRLIPVRAWARYNDKQREERAVLSRPRIQADMIHGYMESQARVSLADHSEVALSPPTMQAFFIDVMRKWRLRPHLLNDDFTIQTNTTRLALEFVEQAPTQLELEFGEPVLTNLHLGYRLNSARSGLASVHIVCPKSKEAVFWHYTLLGPEIDGPLPERAVRPDGPRPRLRPSEAPAEEPRRAGESGA